MKAVFVRGVFIVLLTASRALCADTEPAQWIVVTAPESRAAIEPLCKVRQAEGLKVQVLTTAEVDADRGDRGDGVRLRTAIERLCRGRKSASYVLLVGAATAKPDDAKRTVVPTLRGTAGRMKEMPTDHGYAFPDANLLPTIAVGRFPARTSEEASAMVRKTLAFESVRGGAAWRNRLTVLVGNPGGSSDLERHGAEAIVPDWVLNRFAKLDPAWKARFVVHATGSPFNVADDDLRDVSLGYVREGQLWTIFLGHSAAPGMWSGGARFLDRRDWGELKIPTGPGLFFTCGCYACQLAGADGEGYGLAAARNPAGPVAVIGAHGESYSTFGLLALGGLQERMRGDEHPTRLGDYWLGVESGIVHGDIDAITFWVLDKADGSRGQTSLAEQRREHAEMWTLFGDPAMPMPAPALPIQLKASGAVSVGHTLTITGTLPKELRDTKVRLTLERPLASRPADVASPGKAADLRARLLENNRRANAVELDSKSITARDGQFSGELKLPEELPWSKVTVRAVAESADAYAQGTVSLTVVK